MDLKNPENVSLAYREDEANRKIDRAIIREALKHWQRALENIATGTGGVSKTFKTLAKTHGLCIYVDDYVSVLGNESYHRAGTVSEEFRLCLREYTNETDVSTPFNANFSEYTMESDSEECHLNPKRIAFVDWFMRLPE